MKKTKEQNLLEALIEHSEIEKTTTLIEGHFSDLLFENNLESKNIFNDFFIFSIYKHSSIIQFEINIRNIIHIDIKKETGTKIKRISIQTPNLDFFEVIFLFLKKLKPKNYKIYNKNNIEPFLLSLL